MKLQNINLTHFRNDEHFQFITEVKDLITATGASTLKIAPQFATLLSCYAAQDEAFKKIVKSATTAEIEAADQLRDRTFNGLTTTVKAALNHFDTDVVAAARRLKVVFDTFGNLARKPLNEETSGIYNLVQELNRDYVRDVQAAGLTEWVSKLEAENSAFNTLVKERNTENATKTHLKVKDCRTETDKAYEAIVERINALMVVEGETAYASFVNKLNAFIEKYNHTLAQRQGAAAAAKAKAEKAQE